MGVLINQFDAGRLHTRLAQLTDQHSFCIAYSGGLDSHALLHAMAALQDQYPHYRVRAVHVHHGLSPKADEWAEHCKKVCANLSIPIDVVRVTLDLECGESVEAVAREARYAVFEKMLEVNECLLTAHTQDDQAETLLLQVLRGAGVKGLAAMPVRKALGEGVLLRPLLSVTRALLQAYAEEQGLSWVEDDSNSDERFDRNYLRHRVLPAIKVRWPAASETIARASRHCAEASHTLEQLASIDLESVQSGAGALSIAALQDLSPERRRNVLRHALHWQGGWVPSTEQLRHIERDVLDSRPGADPLFNLGPITLRRYRDELFCLPEYPLPAVVGSWIWELGSPLCLPNGEQLVAHPSTGEGLVADIRRVTVRFREGGERCQPVGRAGHHSLKKLFQEWGVPPWLRDRIPLLYDKENIVAVVGYCISEGYQAADGAFGNLIQRTHRVSPRG